MGKTLKDRYEKEEREDRRKDIRSREFHRIMKYKFKYEDTDFDA